MRPKVLLAESGTDTVDDLGTGSPNLSKNCSAKYAASSLFRSPSPVDKPVFEAVVSLVRRPTRRAMGWPSLPTASATCTASPSRRWWGDLWLGPDGGHEGYNREGIVARTEPLLFDRRGRRLMWKLKAKNDW